LELPDALLLKVDSTLLDLDEMFFFLATFPEDCSQSLFFFLIEAVVKDLLYFLLLLGLTLQCPQDLALPS
jgi:hypothetical protein